MTGRALLAICAGTLLAAAAFTDDAERRIDVLEFRNARIADILVGLGSATGHSIVPDETVVGSASYHFARMTFREALAAFTARFELFVDETGGVFHVSALRVAQRPDGRLDVAAPNADIAQLLQRISRETRTPVLAEPLSGRRLSYYAESLPLPVILEQIAAHLGTYRVVTDGYGYRLSRVDVEERRSAVPAVTEEQGRYSIRAERVSLDDLLAELFRLGGREYQLLIRGGATIGPLQFSEKEFDRFLALVLERADAAFAVIDGIYYITNVSPQSTIAQTLVTEPVDLRYTDAATLLDLLPPERLAGVTVRHDRTSGRLTLTGTEAAVEAVRALIGRLDAPGGARSLRTYDLRSITVATLQSMLPPHLAPMRLIPLPDGRSFVVYASGEQAEALDGFVRLVDVPVERSVVELRSIRVDELLEQLPAGIRRDQIVATTDPARFVFQGNRSERAALSDALSRIDRPRVQVTYHLLVVQFQESRSASYHLDLSNALATPDSEQVFLGSIGNLLRLNFDVVAAFGYQFAATLESQVGRADATVLADATLAGLSGQRVRFANTSTYRYRDTATDPSTGKPAATGVIREIVSGLVLDIDGWVGADDEVTMQITASISRRGADVSQDGNPPATSERIVETRVRTTAGTPVALGGLLQQERDRSVQEAPLLGRIPLVGLLFGRRRQTTETTELAVYIVPRVDRGRQPDAPLDERLRALRDRFLGAAP